MKQNLLLYNIYVLVFCGVIVSCATPIAPTGGPPDKKGPTLEYTKPETGTTNYESRKFEFQFDEFVNRSSVATEITIEPDLSIPYKTDWKRKRLTIEFEEDLPDSTTIIITLGANVADTRGNKIGDPVILAISTGDEIDGGAITGKILSAKKGTGVGNRKVLLYRTPVDYTQRANYQAETDTSGVFEFSYLREGNYQALIVDDRNRNKVWDQSIETAKPFSREFIQLQKDGSDTLDVAYIAESDTIKPKLLGVGLLSTQRMRLRFSEPIQMDESVNLNIKDSTGSAYSSAYPLYIPQKDNFVLLAQSENNLEEGSSYRIDIAGITDLFGNAADTTGFRFTGSAQEDTTLQRVISTNEKNGITQQEPFIVTYATHITESEITDSVVVIEGDVDFEEWPAVQVQRNKLLINPQGEWIEGVDYQFLVWNPKTLRRKIFKPEVWDTTDYGTIEINITNADSAETFTLELLNPEGEKIREADFQGSTALNKLPPISFRLIVYRDLNNNNSWDSGSAAPFQAPEPYYIQRGVSVQRGFTSEINITFN